MCMKITTNNKPRELLDALSLSAEERKEFDYLDWDAIDEGADSATFVRYQGILYDLGEFMRTDAFPGRTNAFPGWSGYTSEGFFCGILVKLMEDDTVIVGRYCS